LQSPVGADPASDDAQFVAKTVAGGLRRVADGRLSTRPRPTLNLATAQISDIQHAPQPFPGMGWSNRSVDVLDTA
jgi:hypothetical protein